MLALLLTNEPNVISAPFQPATTAYLGKRVHLLDIDWIANSRALQVGVESKEMGHSSKDEQDD